MTIKHKIEKYFQSVEYLLSMGLNSLCFDVISEVDVHLVSVTAYWDYWFGKMLL